MKNIQVANLHRSSAFQERKRSAIELRGEGKSIKDISKLLSVTPDTVSKYLNGERKNGERKQIKRMIVDNACDTCGSSIDIDLVYFRGKTLCRECLCPDAFSLEEAIQTASEQLNCLRGAI